MLVIAASAAIAGAESYEDIVLYGTSKAAWLATLLDLTTSNPNIEPQHGISSHDTFRHVFSLTHGEAFEQCFAAWTASRADAFEDEIVAIDGKTMRRSFDRSTGQSPLHIVSAWASDPSLVLAQEVTQEKSNEITAIPKVLETLQLEGALVTIDAMGCQTKIAEAILEKKADEQCFITCLP